MESAATASSGVKRGAKKSFWQRVVRDFKQNKYIYLMLSPVLAYYIIFHYAPMYGAQIAFRDYIPALGIAESEWIGWENFQDFFTSPSFTQLVRNTLAINFIDLIFGFPAPIILALLLNELTSPKFKRLVQTVTYMPFFISIVVLVGMVLDFAAREGLINQVLISIGLEPINFMTLPEWYGPIYVGASI